MFLLYKKKKAFESPFHHFPLSPETLFLCIMKGMTLKENIIQLAHSIGISKIGFTTADDFAYLEKSLRLAVEEGRNSGFEHKNIEERIQPKLSLSSAKTIISIAVAYPHKLKQHPQKTAYKRGKFTPNSWGLDYHYVLQDKLNRLAAGIEEMTQDFEYKGMVDTGALVDTAVAQRAGIKTIACNCVLDILLFFIFIPPYKNFLSFYQEEI